MSKFHISALFSVAALLLLCSAAYGQENRNPHGNLSLDCRQCHSTESWSRLLSPLPFTHDSTAFPLTGRHLQTPCLSCHQSLVFAEANAACASCHADIHSGQFGNQCQRCHTPHRWDDRARMIEQHAATRFPLLDAHAHSDCQTCHDGGRFAGLSTECASCHSEDYKNTREPDHTAAGFSVSCEQCHAVDTDDWGGVTYNHTSRFQLTGAHLLQQCSACHQAASYAMTSGECFACHETNYRNALIPDHATAQFSRNCAECHNTTTWQPSTFDHHQTAFDLTGAHINSVCQQCHIGGVFSGTSRECWGCHQTDYDNTESPAHAATQISHACEECHTTDAWSSSTFDHAATDFPLTGAHVTASCQQCHVNGQFAGTAQECWNCHQTDYDNTASPDHKAGQLPRDCMECHTTSTWSPSAFSHSATEFPLTGAHVIASCQECHINGQFAETAQECWDCHRTDYRATLTPDHTEGQLPRECLECHTTNAWVPSLFNHSTTIFPLTGIHVTVSCQQCHTHGQFIGTSTECWSCHQSDYVATRSPDHTAGQLPRRCTECHSTEGWIPSTFNHASTTFSLTGAHTTALCQQCHIDGQFAGTPGQCLNCHQLNYDATSDPNHQAAGFGTACQTCHTTANWNTDYDHDQTGFMLAGAHTELACIQCHIDNRFAGTPSDCYGCHRSDYETVPDPDHDTALFPHDCAVCHSVNSWSPAAFDHDISSFPLTGAHAAASCVECHADGRYTGTPSDCWSCHQSNYADADNPEHSAAQLPHDCQQCHSTTGWTPSSFSHASTAFPLTGAHIATACQECHVGGQFAGTPADCWSCHEPDYDGTASPNHESAQLPHACAECHNTAVWNPSDFNHGQTAFPLSGAHAATSCQQCHINGQFAGTPTDCWSCHQSNYVEAEDPEHSTAQLPHDCQQCHSTGGWTPSSFSHSATAFPLTGVHAATSCQQCHVNGQFAGTPTDCWSCHQSNYAEADNPNHSAAQLPHDCQQCHATSVWTPSSFSHSATAFPLTGAHTTVSCQQCHVNGQFAGTPTECSACHGADYNSTENPNHAAADFPMECQACHTTANWDAAYDHSQTQFPLTGLHAVLSCMECHSTGQYDGLGTACFSCHSQNYQIAQNPDHAAGQLPHTCEECHTTSAWMPSNFTHNQTAFPLAGAHAAASCQQCHINGQFAGTPTDCWSCHQADYNGTTSPDHEIAQLPHDCQQCHATSAWSPSSFSHSATTFPLAGAHAATSCQQCHINGQFAGTPTDCWSCHQTDYNATTLPNHTAAQIPHGCTQCHGTTDWTPANFNHNQTSFPLAGAHTTVSCQQCHVNGQFAGTPMDCWSCHQSNYAEADNPNHSAAQLPHECQQCHSTDGWTPSSFSHSATAFPLTGAHAAISCQQCHLNGQFAGTPMDCWSCHQTDYNGTDSPDHETSLLPHDCLQCHATSAWTPANFNHSQTGFPLTGAHTAVSCQQCHVNGQFAGTPTDCWSCHQTDYNGTTSPDHEIAQLPHACAECHSNSAWTPSSFSHNQTGFPLTGAHTTADCQQCHLNGQFPETPSTCFACHNTDYHSSDNPNHSAAGFSTACQSCHTTSNWNANYNHNQTGYPLVGEHRTAQCAQCHISGPYSATPTDCWSCHDADYQGTVNPNHQAGGFPQTCEVCHTATGWTPAQFDHNLTDFPLTGSHTQVSCAQCHPGGQYAGTQSECWSCHQTDYNGANSPNHAAAQFSQSCAECHNTSAWSPSSFSHSATEFPLTGAHVTASCQQCHLNGQFAGTSSDCFACHESDYNGTDDPDHEAAQFPTTCQACHTTSNWEAEFDHNQTQFPLTGAHLSAVCIQCHSSGQYNGLSPACFSCHQADYQSADDPNHAAGQLPQNCIECHTTSGWIPSTFNHASTAFPLTGAHAVASCQQCHTNGQFAGTPSECWSCHQTDYNTTAAPDHETAQFPQICTECHATNAWVPSTFNHAATDFPLTGAHISASCQQCHANGQYAGTPALCLACHSADYQLSNDPNHTAAGFPTTCQNCHTTGNWEANYNHSLTGFPLTGAHISARCIECHASGQYHGLSDACFACHQADYQSAADPNHAAAQLPIECAQCHTTNGWTPSSFNHTTTSFPLTGAHVAANCQQCHVNGQFEGTPTECYTCHAADYAGTNDPAHAASGFPTTCQTCHTTTNWEASFNHNQTGFPLSGAHATASCQQCHTNGQYSGTPTDCWSCHQSDFNGTTLPDHEAAQFPHTCTECHTTQAWSPSSFNHSTTGFPLTGAHISANCVQCHANGQYAGTSTQCHACHAADYNATNDPDHQAAGFPTTCEICHTTSNWDATFNHDGPYFPIYSGQHRNEWNTCSDCHTNPNNFAVFTCLNCHEHNRSETDSHHHGVQGYIYQSSACYSCHPRGDAGDSPQLPPGPPGSR